MSRLCYKGADRTVLKNVSPFTAERNMPDERITVIALGDYLDFQIDECLELIKSRNPGVEFSRDQLIRLAVGYGLDRIVRRRERRRLHLYGSYQWVYPPGAEGMMTVESLSLSGAGFKTVEDNAVKVNDILHIRFHLEDSTQTVIHKNVVVRNVRDRHVGVAFSEPVTDTRLKRFLERAPEKEPSFGEQESEGEG